MKIRIKLILSCISILLLLSCHYVKANNISVNGIELNKTSINLEIGQVEQLTATIKPYNASNQKIRWSSNNNNIASVAGNGEIKGVGKGVTTITVTTEESGYSAYCTVIVSGTSNITSDKYSISIEQSQLGESVNYIKKISPNTKLADFRNNISTYSTIKVKNLSNKEIGDNDVIATGMKLYLVDNSEYTLSVTGDVNSDGKVSIIDLSRLKAYIVGLTTLDEAQLHGADINFDGKTTILDLSMMKQILTGLIKV